jgi:hypothetical protein
MNMAEQQPRHRLPSFGRIDAPKGPTEMTVAPMSVTSSQPPPTKTEAEQLLDAVHRSPQRQQEHNAAVAARNLTADEKLRAIREFNDPSLDPLGAAFDQYAAKYDESYQNVVAGLTSSVDESTAGRIARRQLDYVERAESPVTATQKILKSAATDQELGVALQELPSWLEARGHPVDFISEVLKEVRPDDVGAAAVKRDKGFQVRDIGHQTIKQVRRGIETGTPAQHLMPIKAVADYDPERM